MKAPDEQPAEPAEAEQETPREEDEPTGRGPAIALSVLGAVAAWRLVAAFPEVALIAAGSLGTIGVQQARARWAGRAEEADGDAEEAEAPDIAEALRTLVGGDNGVLLTRLQKYLSLPNTKAVKALLEADGITWKGVRTSGGNGPGVHKNDIPAAVTSPVTDVHGNGCCCRSDDNGNSGNGREGEHGKGIRVDRTDGGFLIHDLDDAGRHGSARNAAP